MKKAKYSAVKWSPFVSLKDIEKANQGRYKSAKWMTDEEEEYLDSLDTGGNALGNLSEAWKDFKMKLFEAIGVKWIPEYIRRWMKRNKKN